MDTVNFAYLAGVMDSDGSFSIAIRHRTRKNPNYTAMCQLTWTQNKFSLKFMQALKKQYGGSISEVKPTGFANARPCYRYMVLADKAVLMIEDILPFLQLKRKQARNLIRIQQTNKKRGPGRTIKMKQFKEKLYKNNISLNTKNSDRKIDLVKEL